MSCRSVLALLSLSTLTLFAGSACSDQAPRELGRSTPTDSWSVRSVSTNEAARPVSDVERVAYEASEGFVVHEWGTFTSVQTSEGVTLGRMYEEDEPLPGFVHRYQPGSPRHSKGFALTDANVYSILESATQRLETPVIYFHGARDAQEVEVTVDFPHGVVSEWYPGHESISPSVGEFDALEGGSMTWKAPLHERDARVIPVPEDDVWAPSRRVDAMTVKHHEQEEPFIFYRGVGAFEFPVRTTSSRDGQVTIRNGSEHALPAVFLYKRDAEGVSFLSFGRLEPGRSIRHGGDAASPSPKESPGTVRTIAEAKENLVAELVEAGLYHDEAVSMVETWDRSYFETHGTRVLYVVPREWTDELLPIRVTPAPDVIERVLVGRIEVTPATHELALERELRERFERGDAIYDVPSESLLLDRGATSRVEYAGGVPISPALLPRLHALQLANEGTQFGGWMEHVVERRHSELSVLR